MRFDNCPKCGFELTEAADACPRCGLLFEKWTERRKARREVIVSTGDVRGEYEIIGPVFFQTSNKGFFASQLAELIGQYRRELQEWETAGQASKKREGFSLDRLIFFSVGENDFDKAFYICIEEMKKRAARLGADAVIYVRQQMELDTIGFQFFYVQAYGTAVRMRTPEHI